MAGEGKNTRYFSQSSAHSYDVYDANLKKINEFSKIEVCESFYAGMTDSNSDTYTIYDLNDKVLYENAERDSNATHSYKIDDNKLIQHFEFGDYKNYIILDENQEKLSGLHHGYTLVKTTDPSDSDKKSYAIYDYKGKICDIGSKSVDECDNVNLYKVDNKYYNYNGKLIYEKKDKN